MIEHPENADEESVAHSWNTTPTAVLVDVDAGIAPLVAALNTVPGIRTYASCQGHRLGVEKRAYVMLGWREPADFEELQRRVHQVETGWSFERVSHEHHGATLYVEPDVIDVITEVVHA